MFAATTGPITVTVEPRYLEQDSEPEAGRYVWSYRVTIANRGPEPVRLEARHWEITDGRGQVQEVDGIGVVGEQPLIGPGETYTYTSGCPLPTPSGFMRGHYAMTRESGERFEANIPLFPLDRPGLRVLN